MIMESTELKRVRLIAEEMVATFPAEDERWSRSVFIIHEEGTTLRFRWAFLMEYYDAKHGNWGASMYPGQWLFVFTEHHGIHIYAIEDLIHYEQLQLCEIEKCKGYPKPAWKCRKCTDVFIEPIKPQYSHQTEEGLVIDYHEEDVCPFCNSNDIGKWNYVSGFEPLPEQYKDDKSITEF